jgi:O-succinylbenzoate synthase
MKIDGVKAFSYTLPLTKPLRLRHHTITHRQGLLLRINDIDGHLGWGETAPLPGFSTESYVEAIRQIIDLHALLTDVEIPDSATRLDGSVSNLTESMNLLPSVQFGVESAILNLLANAAHTPLCVLLGGEQSPSVALNALASGTTREILRVATEAAGNGFRAIKVKVGRNPLVDEISLVTRLSQNLKNTDASVTLRLDANRAWDFDEAAWFAEGIADCAIEYIEEPCATLEDSLKVARNTGLPIALDESLTDLQPQQLEDVQGCAAVVLKPTLLGGVEKSTTWARQAQKIGIKAVMSSSFESSLGILTLAHMAATMSDDQTPHGLDTLDWFEQDLLVPPLTITNGALELRLTAGNDVQPRLDLLTEITHG